jgi:hypothetical protein
MLPQTRRIKVLIIPESTTPQGILDANKLAKNLREHSKNGVETSICSTSQQLGRQVVLHEAVIAPLDNPHLNIAMNALQLARDFGILRIAYHRAAHTLAEKAAIKTALSPDTGNHSELPVHIIDNSPRPGIEAMLGEVDLDNLFPLLLIAALHHAAKDQDDLHEALQQSFERRPQANFNTLYDMIARSYAETGTSHRLPMMASLFHKKTTDGHRLPLPPAVIAELGA